MAYELIIEPKAQRFLKKLKKKNPDAASAMAMDIIDEDIYHRCEFIKDGFFS